MREIKFRFKDPKGFLFIIDVNDLCSITQEEYNTWIYTGQYTGLKDKDGKEIYEGDIVEETFSHCREGFTGQVEFGLHDTDSDDCEGCQAYGWYLINSNNETLGFNEWNSRNEELEVLSNIYKNKELLGVKNE